MKGTIKTLKADKGFCFILGEDGKEYFGHRTAFKNAKLDEVREGDEVEFEEADSAKGLRAEDIYT
jgi:CspA family cold shock protein